MKNKYLILIASLYVLLLGTATLLCNTALAVPVPDWPQEGVRVSTSHLSMTTGIQTIADGQGGIIYYWYDESYSPWTKRMLPNGTGAPGWGEGLPCPKSTDIMKDGSGGVFLLFLDKTNGTLMLARHYRQDGSIDSSQEGRQLLKVDGIASATQFKEDAQGNIFFAWSSASGTRNISCIRFDRNFNVSPGWPLSGLPVATSGTWGNLGATAGIVPDESGGAFVIWAESKTESEGYLAVKRIDGNGSIHTGWEQGRVLSDTGCYTPLVISDKCGGVLAMWAQLIEKGSGGGTMITAPNRPSTYLAYGARMDHEGNAVWRRMLSVGGISSFGPIPTLSVSDDYYGGGFFSWSSGSTSEVDNQHLNSSGQVIPGWENPAQTPAGNYFSDGGGGAYVFGNQMKRFDSTGKTYPGWPSAGLNLPAYGTITRVSDRSFVLTSTYPDFRAWKVSDSIPRPNFDTYILLENPGEQDTEASISFMLEDGTIKTVPKVVAAHGRTTVDVNEETPFKSVSTKVTSPLPLVCERSMYFNYQGKWDGGSDAMGATAPSTAWYFAEGTTLPGFDEYVTVQNPGNESATLAFHYMVEGQGEQLTWGNVAPHSRATFHTADQIGAGKNASLYLASTKEVVAERPMYFDYRGLSGNHWTGGHDVVGATSPNKQWYLAEGTTRSGFEEWLCLQNPGGEPISVNATYQLGSGQGGPVAKSYIVPAKERLTVSVNKELGPDKDNSVYLSSASDFIAERPMYFNYNNVWNGGHDVLGANAPSKSWFFAEGTTRDNFDEWLCLQNPGEVPAQAQITYFPASGGPIERPVSVPANSRVTVKVRDQVPAGLDVSAKVTSDNPIVVERSMYFIYNGMWTGGHDAVGVGAASTTWYFAEGYTGY